jgi:hypothetical protein
LRQFNSEVAKQYKGGALELLVCSRYFAMLNLVFVEDGRKGVDDDPGDGAAKVHGFMHHKGHDARSKHIILHVGVPGGPKLLEIVERGIGDADLVECRPVFRDGVRKRGGGVPGNVVRSILAHREI